MTHSWFFKSPSRHAVRARLVCFPYAGGSGQIFRDWPKTLGPEVEVVGIQLPGRGARMHEAPLQDLGEIVRHICDALATLPELPFAFFGHSNGALISFEVARELIRRGRPLPQHMIISAKRAPQLARLGPMTFHLPHDKFVDVLRDYEGTPRDILDEPELLALILPSVRCDFAISELYRFDPLPQLDLDFTLLGSQNDKFVPYHDLLPWAAVTTGKVNAHVIGGGHFFMHSHATDVLSHVGEVVHGLYAEKSH